MRPPNPCSWPRGLSRSSMWPSFPASSWSWGFSTAADGAGGGPAEVGGDTTVGIVPVDVVPAGVVPVAVVSVAVVTVSGADAVALGAVGHVARAPRSWGCVSVGVVSVGVVDSAGSGLRGSESGSSGRRSCGVWRSWVVPSVGVVGSVLGGGAGAPESVEGCCSGNGGVAVSLAGRRSRDRGRRGGQDGGDRSGTDSTLRRSGGALTRLIGCASHRSRWHPPLSARPWARPQALPASANIANPEAAQPRRRPRRCAVRSVARVRPLAAGCRLTVASTPWLRAGTRPAR